jgi:non-ribosomal peptide synthetase component E (peptide arylation enzyme)
MHIVGAVLGSDRPLATFCAAANGTPQITYISSDDRDLTFSEADVPSESLAASLLEIGLCRAGAVVQLGTVKELVVASFWCFKASVIPVWTLPQFLFSRLG